MNQMLVVLSGPPGCGKSTICKRIKRTWQHKHFVTICPDEIREELCNGDRSCQDKNAAVFRIAFERLEEAAQSGKDVIFDSTAVSVKRRRPLLEVAKKHGMFAYAMAIEIPLEQIKQQNKGRKWEVPEFVIDRMFNQYVRPSEEEGFDRVKVHTGE